MAGLTDQSRPYLPDQRRDRAFAWRLGALLAAAVLAIAVLPARETRDLADPKDRIAALNDGRRTWAQIFGGTFLAVSLWLAWENVVIAREGKITDRFSKAIDQLAHDKLAVRLGGIYALERVARDSPRDHWTIVEVLTAYVREQAHWARPDDYQSLTQFMNTKFDPTDRTYLAMYPNVLPDVQAVLTVLGRRRIEHDGGRLDLSNVQLRNAVLTGAQLSGANLSGSDLEGALLDNAILDNATANGTSFENAALNGASLRGTHLRGAHLEQAEINDAHLEKACLISAELMDTELRRSSLDGADLDSARMMGTVLDGASLCGADLRHVRGLRKSQLAKAKLDSLTKLPDDLA